MFLDLLNQFIKFFFNFSCSWTRMNKSYPKIALTISNGQNSFWKIILLLNLTSMNFIYKMCINSFTLGCPSGYDGKNCSNHQCSKNCKVANDWDRFTGQCDGECKPGWTGITCDYSTFVLLFKWFVFYFQKIDIITFQ